MDSQSLKNVLGILRLIHSGPDQTAIDFIERLAGKKLSGAQTLRVAATLVDQFSAATLVIQNSRLSAEGKAGVLASLSSLSAAFSVKKLAGNIGAVKASAPAAISNFVILLDASGSEAPPPPPDAANLAEEVDRLVDEFDDPEIDPVVRDVAKKHLAVLATLLRHIPIFGAEAALVSYFELLMKLRRADVDTSPEAKKKAKPLWEKIEKWSTRISAIDKAVNSGASLANNANKATALLDYIPNIG